MTNFKIRLTAVFVLLLAVLLASTALAADTPECLTFCYTDAAPEVDAPQVFLAIYDGVCDICIEGERASYTFFYENIFRSTEKWRPFSSAVGVKPLSEAGASVSAEIAGASGTDAYVMDFRDGDYYPGTASVSVRVDDVVDASKTYALYEFVPGLIASDEGEEDSAAALRPIARGLSVGADGCISFTMTESHDFILVRDDEATVTALSAYAYVPDYAAPTGLFAGANIGWIVFFVLVGLALIGLLIYLVTVKVLMKRRKSKKKALSEKKK